MVWWLVMLLGFGMQSIALNTKQQLDRQAINQVQEARALLLAYSLAHPGLVSSSNKPWAGLMGFLPCPDVSLSGLEGNQEGHCGAKGVASVGHFPWRYFEQTPFRTGSAQCLWYVVSGTHKQVGESVMVDEVNADVSSGLVFKGEEVVFVLLEPLSREVCEAGYRSQDWMAFVPLEEGRVELVLNEDIRRVYAMQRSAFWRALQATKAYEALIEAWWLDVVDCVDEALAQSEVEMDSPAQALRAEMRLRGGALTQVISGCHRRISDLEMTRLNAHYGRRLLWQKQAEGWRLSYAGEALSGQSREGDWSEDQGFEAVGGNDWRVCFDDQSQRVTCGG